MKANRSLAGSRAWARSELGTRWLALVALGVLAGATAAFSMAAFAGGRRTATALTRLRATTHASDAVVFASQTANFHPDLSALAHRPEIRDLAVWDLVFGDIDGQPNNVLFASDDGRWGTAVDRPVVIAGRMWNPHAPDELVVAEPAAKDVPLGSTFRFRAQTQAQLAPSYDGPGSGPTVAFHVVGVVRMVENHVFTPGGIVGPGYLERYRSQVGVAPNAFVRLRAGGDPVADLRRDADQLIGPGTPVLDFHASARKVTTTMSVQAAGLLALGAAAAFAGGLLVLQALIRSSGRVAEDARALRAVGMTPRQIAAGAVIAHLPGAAVAAVGSVAAAIAASSLLPVGLARHVDPNPGVHADWTVLGGGAALTVAFIVVAVYASARRAIRRTGGKDAAASPVAGWFRRWAPLPVGIGVTAALERGPRAGRAGLALRPVLVAAVAGVVGVVGALTVDAGLRDALAHPQRAGVVWDASLQVPAAEVTSSGVADPFFAKIRNASPGAVLAIVDRDTAPVNGVGAPAYDVRPPVGQPSTPISLTIVAGRAPHAEGEVALGPATLRLLHLKLGSRTEVGDHHTKVVVVGEALFSSDVHADFDEGVWMTPTQFDNVLTPSGESGGRRVALRYARGADKASEEQRLQEVLGNEAFVTPLDDPPELVNLRNVRTLPDVLAIFLALLASCAVSHLLLSTASASRRQFAILRALGVRRGTTRLAMHAQAVVIGFAGLAVGIPLGLAVGRTEWRVIADRVPLEDIPPLAVGAMVLVVPVAIVIANLLALWPGRRVARLRPAQVLRQE